MGLKLKCLKEFKKNNYYLTKINTYNGLKTSQCFIFTRFFTLDNYQGLCALLC